MTNSRADQIRALLRSIETGDPEPIQVVDQSRYIQHNPQTHEGSEGLESLFKRLSQTNPRVSIVRAFEDGDYVFAHTEYDFSRRNIGFEIFRFEGDKAVEHWDNIQPRRGPNASGNSMVDGPVDAIDIGQTEDNRALVTEYTNKVLIAGDPALAQRYVAPDLIQHNPEMVNGRAALCERIAAQGDASPRYLHLHRVLACGNFVLAVSEGAKDGRVMSLYDLCRIEAGMIAEHWDTIEKVPPKEEWKNDNGKF